MHIDKLAEKHQAAVKKITKKMIYKALSIYPIYKLKDNSLKHKLAKSTLRSVEVKNEKLLITLSIF